MTRSISAILTNAKRSFRAIAYVWAWVQSISRIFTRHCTNGEASMKTTLVLALATLVPGMFLMQANGGAMVAVIDFERAVSEAPGGKDAITKITTFRSEQLAAITAKQREADELENRLRVQDRALTTDARTQLT